ncbi:DNA-binding domain-containing protein [Ectopseudomonas khazarica]|uniref:HvfC family RiPP maturation protein n=1 Tax=Ectopseudomonas khazarica TaxID=2502979 RepID=UPI00055A19A0
MKGIELQRDFAARIRQPDAHGLLPGIAAERMAIYEELFFNNVASLVSGAFPVLRGVLGAERWQRLVRGFLAEHRAATPYFLEISQEFIAWLQQGYRPEPDDPPFMLELAHYEWVELALDVSEAQLPQRGWSPLAWPLAYVWPVQRIGAEHCPALPPDEPTCLLVWRDGKDQVRFMQLTPFAYQLALRLQAGESPLQAQLALATAAGLAADRSYFANARALLEDWQARDIWFPYTED